LRGESNGIANRNPVLSSEKSVEPATRIERTTCGLRIATDHFSLPSSSSPEPTESQVEWPE
jgi:hypothetical protein